MRPLQPAGLRRAGEIIRFGRSHRLSSSEVDWLRMQYETKSFGLELLPSGLALDGLILDIGANAGDFTATVRRLEPRSRVVCFEPMPGVARDLRARFSDDTLVTVEQVAVSDQEGSATLNVTGDDHFSSLQTPKDELRGIYAGLNVGVVEQPEVRTVALDSLIREPVRVMKIDVQGHEISAFKGAGRVLEETSAILTEVTFRPHYDGDADFFAIHSYLSDRGFRLAGLTQGSRPDGWLAWADACYTR